MKVLTLLRVAALLVLGASLLAITTVSAAPSAPRVPTAGNWNPFPTPGLTPNHPLYAVTAPATNDAWAVGAEGGVYHYSGSAWSEVTSNTTLTLQSVSAVPGVADTAIVVGANEGPGSPSLVMTCTLAGCTRDMTVPRLGWLDSVWVVSADDYWVAGGASYPQSGTILHFSGGVWSANMVTGSVPNVHYHNIQMISSGEGYAVGEGTTADAPGKIIHYTTAAGWQAINTGLTYSGSLHGLWFLSADEGWIVGGTLSENPVILHYRKASTQPWTKDTVQGLTTPTLLWFVAMNPDRTGYAVGNDGLILSHAPGSPIWEPVFADPTYQPLYGMWLVPGGAEGWAVGGSDNGSAIIDQMTGGRPLTPRLWMPEIRR